MIARWPHQLTAARETLAAIAGGQTRIVVTSPTGGGKSLVACDLIDAWVDAGHRVVLYTNRKLLVEQLTNVLQAHGIDHGIRAAGWYAEHHKAVQISSIQTESTRARKAAKLAGTWNLHSATRVLVDEVHLHTGPEATSILDCHAQHGAAIVGLTATPLGLARHYDHLIQAGTTSQLRDCGALVRCKHYGPDEPDLRSWREEKAILDEGKDLSEARARKVMMTDGIFGRVLEWFEKLNPEHRPSILFAPGVKESLWFAEQFVAAGISAAHIDGASVWVEGETYFTSPDVRRQVLEGSKDGTICVLCNRYVLREGIDAPWLAHGVFATIFGSVQSYLQSGGRLLRSFPGLDAVTLQDHGGNWWRHGSLNANRSWNLDDTAASVQGTRQDALHGRQEKEPSSCPRCRLVLTGRTCPCGFEITQRSRAVVQSDGTLRQLGGDLYAPRRVYQKPDGKALWERMYHRSKTKKGERTFRAAMGLFAYENHFQWPDPSWPLMPKNPKDYFRLVAEVEMSDLIPKE